MRADAEDIWDDSEGSGCRGSTAWEHNAGPPEHVMFPNMRSMVYDIMQRQANVYASTCARGERHNRGLACDALLRVPTPIQRQSNHRVATTSTTKTHRPHTHSTYHIPHAQGKRSVGTSIAKISEPQQKNMIGILPYLLEKLYKQILTLL